MKISKLTVILALTFFSNDLLAQIKDYIKIEIFPDLHTYIISENNIMFYQEIIINGKKKSILKLNKKIKYSKDNFNLHFDFLKSLDSKYIDPMLGGQLWILNVVRGDEKFSINIENMCVPSINKLFIYFNNHIRRKSYKIHLMED